MRSDEDHAAIYTLQPPAGSRVMLRVATTDDPVGTELPGPRSRALLERKERVVAEPALDLPADRRRRGARRDAHRRRRQRLHRLHGRRRRASTWATRRRGSSPPRPSSSRASRTRTSRSCRTRATSRSPSGSSGSCRSPARCASRCSTRVPRRSRTPSRSRGRRPGARRSIVFDGAFHGRTLMAMTLTSKTHPYKAGLGPFAPEVYRVPFAEPLPRPGRRSRARRRSSAPSPRASRPRRWRRSSSSPCRARGASSCRPVEFVQGLRRICDEHGIVLVADEVQTGFCRTGRMFAMEHFGVEPDLMTVAKSIAGGLPLSGVIGRAEIMNAPPDSAIGGTFPGNPVACAAALGVLDTIEAEGLVERADDGRRRRFAAGWRLAGAVRRRSATCAVSARCSRSSSFATGRRRSRHPSWRPRSSSRRRRRGLLLLKAGVYGNCIRVLVPLVIGEDELERGARRLGRRARRRPRRLTARLGRAGPAREPGAARRSRADGPARPGRTRPGAGRRPAVTRLTAGSVPQSPTALAAGEGELDEPPQQLRVGNPGGLEQLRVDARRP